MNAMMFGNRRGGFTSPQVSRRKALTATVGGGLALIEALLVRYRESGLLDDSTYAAARVESLHRRGDSLRAIRARLAAKGVPAAVAADAISGLHDKAPDPDLAAACAFARRRRLGPRDGRPAT